VANEWHCRSLNVKPAERVGNAPLLLMSFDIETLTQDLGHGATAFYKGDDANAKCLSIGVVFWFYGTDREERYVLSLGDEGDKDTEAILWYDSEVRLLTHFTELIKEKDPDFITGYNINGFDWKWLFERARALHCVETFSAFGRCKDWPKVAYDDTRRNGKEPKVPIKIPGRVPYDLMGWLKKNRSLREYNLNFVAKTYLKQEKDDVAYNEIGHLFETYDGRVKLAQYCLKDTQLVINLIRCKFLDPIGKDMAVSTICGVYVADLSAKGTQHTLRCKLLRLAKEDKFLIPSMDFDEGGDEDAWYEGVLPPKSCWLLSPCKQVARC